MYVLILKEIPSIFFKKPLKTLYIFPKDTRKSRIKMEKTFTHSLSLNSLTSRIVQAFKIGVKLKIFGSPNSGPPPDLLIFKNIYNQVNMGAESKIFLH